MHLLVLSIELDTVQTGTGKVDPTRKFKCIIKNIVVESSKIKDIVVDSSKIKDIVVDSSKIIQNYDF